jgi:hypothetical protein
MTIPIGWREHDLLGGIFFPAPTTTAWRIGQVDPKRKLRKDSLKAHTEISPKSNSWLSLAACTIRRRI